MGKMPKSKVPQTKVTVGKRSSKKITLPTSPMNEPTANRRTLAGGGPPNTSGAGSAGGRMRTRGRKR
jgi:hypothetical protein